MKNLLKLAFLMIIFGITVTCKDDNVSGTEELAVVTIIQEEFKTETISSSAGETIELAFGVKIEIPDCLQAGALPAYLNSVKIISIKILYSSDYYFYMP
jgi:hypothetical protein